MAHAIPVHPRRLVRALGHTPVLRREPERVLLVRRIAAVLARSVAPDRGRHVLLLAVYTDTETRLGLWTPCSAVSVKPVVARIDAVAADVAHHVRTGLRGLIRTDSHALIKLRVPENATVQKLARSARCAAPDWGREIQLSAEPANVVRIVRLLAPLGAAVACPVRQSRGTAFAYPVKPVHRKLVWTDTDALVRNWVIEHIRSRAHRADRTGPEWCFCVVFDAADALLELRVPDGLLLTYGWTGGAGAVLPDRVVGVQLVAVLAHVVPVGGLLAVRCALPVLPILSAVRVAAGPALLVDLVPYRGVH